MSDDLIPDHMIGLVDTDEPKPRVSVSTKQKLIDFVERVGTSAFLAGYGTYVLLPHVSNTADLKVAAFAAAGSAAKYVAKVLAVWQAANLSE